MRKADTQVNFRMPGELRDKLKSAADASGRTLTAEIVHRLQASLAEDVDVLKDDSVTDLKRLQADIDKIKELVRATWDAQQKKE